MRVLICIEPLMYSQTLAFVLRGSQRDLEVFVPEPGERDAGAERLSPDLVVCNEPGPVVRDLATSWLAVLYADGLVVRACVGGEEWVVENAGIDFLLDVVDRTRALINAR